MDHLLLTQYASLGITIFGALVWTGIVVRSVLQRASLISQSSPNEQRILSDGEIIMSILGVGAFSCFLMATVFSFALPGNYVPVGLLDGLSMGDVLRGLLVLVEVCFAGIGVVWVWTQERFVAYRRDAAKKGMRRRTDTQAPAAPAAPPPTRKTPVA